MDVLHDEVWLVWSHEHGSWWKPNDWGYTPNAAEAGRYALLRALDVCANAGKDRYGAPHEVVSPSPELIEHLRNADVPPGEPLAWGIHGKAGLDVVTRIRMDAEVWEAEGRPVVLLSEMKPPLEPFRVCMECSQFAGFEVQHVEGEHPERYTEPRRAENGGCVATRRPKSSGGDALSHNPDAGSACGRRDTVATVPLTVSGKSRMCFRCARQSSANGFNVEYDDNEAALESWKAVDPERRAYEIREMTGPLGGEIHLRDEEAKKSAWANGVTFQDALNTVLYKWGQDSE